MLLVRVALRASMSRGGNVSRSVWRGVEAVRHIRSFSGKVDVTDRRDVVGLLRGNAFCSVR